MGRVLQAIDFSQKRDLYFVLGRDKDWPDPSSPSPESATTTMIENPLDIRYACEKAWHHATTGRPGPVWIDIPVNFQGCFITISFKKLFTLSKAPS